MPHNPKATSETIEVTQPYLTPTTSQDTMKLILKNIFLPVSIKLGKTTTNLKFLIFVLRFLVLNFEHGRKQNTRISDNIP